MQFKKIKNETVESILATYEPSDEILAITNAKMAPDEFLKVAVDNELYMDAVAFLAHALPLRESIYWAYLTVATLKEKFNSPKDKEILIAVENWFKSPDEANRRACGALAEELKLKTGPAWLSEAVFWSGGSILPPGQPDTEPAQYLYAKAVSGSVNLSASLDEKELKTVHANFKKVLKIGFNLAEGGNGKI